jgi:hypothetical protein
MKKIQTVLFFLLFTTYLFAQGNFEGYIIYKNEPQNPSPTTISDTLFQKIIKQSLGGQNYVLQKYIYKEDNYLSEMSMGKSKTYQLYTPVQKRVYTWQEDKDTASYTLSEKYSDKIQSIKSLDGEEIVLGVKCKKLQIISTTTTTTYWYNSDTYKIDYRLYQTHNYGFWNEFLKIAGALPLKFQVKTKTYDILTTATEVKETKIMKNVFDIPKFKGLVQDMTN